MAQVQQALGGGAQPLVANSTPRRVGPRTHAPRNTRKRPIRSSQRQPIVMDEKTWIQRLKNRLTPVNKCPDEVLGHIFVLCLPQWGGDICNGESKAWQEPVEILWTYYAPILLGSVCADWRDLVINCPALWTSPSIYIPHPYKPWNQRGLLDMWLERSGRRTKLSLTVRIQAPVTRPRKRSNRITLNSPTQRSLGMSDFFSQHLGTIVRRINRLDITSSERDLKLFFLYVRRLSNLESLIIRNLESKETNNFLDMRSLLFLPVEFKPGSSAYPFRSMWGLPWGALKELHITLRDCPTWHRLLRGCPNLQRASVTLKYMGCGNSVHPRYTDPINELQHLRSLGIRLMGKECSLAKIFEGLYFPALSHFNLSNAMMGPPSSQVTEFDHFFEQVKSLRSFVFVGGSDLLINILKRTPLLTHLDLTVSKESDIRPVLDFLLETQGQVVALPHLANLKIEVDGFDGVVDSENSAKSVLPFVLSADEFFVREVREVIEFRSNTGAPLKDCIWNGHLF